MELIKNFIKESEERVLKPLQEMDQRFPSVEKLLSRIRPVYSLFKDINSVKNSHFSSAIKSLRENHNEACVALSLLESGIDRLDYEWQETEFTRCIDFLVIRDNKRIWVEVKTIHPDNIDAWEDFERVINRNLITDRVRVHLEQNGLGGEIWHHMKSARSKMLEYTMDTEDKINSLDIDVSCEAVELWFCGGGFRWMIDDLEDFVAFYLTNRHRPDDPFSKMEAYYINERSIELQRSIKRFGYLERPDPRVLPVKFCIPVLPPASPW